MHRWGAWGHYDGKCDQSNCRYSIKLADSIWYDSDSSKSQWAVWPGLLGRLGLLQWFGGRPAVVGATFTVQDGTIWRETAWIVVDPVKMFSGNSSEAGPELIVETKSRQRLRETLDDWWEMGDDDQLAQHPYYKAGIPGGCEMNCEAAVVTYSTRTPPAEIEWLTSFNFSCLTRFSPCTTLEELLPAANGWNLYHEGESITTQRRSSQPKPCDIPVWALARDARYALAIEAISNGTERRYDRVFEKARVRIVAILKGNPPWKQGAILDAYPFSGSSDSPPFEEPEHLLNGKRYVVFPAGDDRKDMRLTQDSPIGMDRCGVQDDTPETRRELERGLAMNDDLRVPERW
ncbi:MAG: hypothetical protein ABSF23_01215 [Terracidiphilus sp.]|jgi:hypothetical protein